MANALRALGRLSEASAQFDDARFLLRHHLAIDPLTAAELDKMEGTLRRDQRRFDDARQLLERAALAYEMVGIFEGQEIHREAATALHLFRDAAKLELLSLDLVRHLATYLVQASREPALVYRAGS